MVNMNDENRENENDDFKEEVIEGYKSRKAIRIIASITALCLVLVVTTPIFTNINLPTLDFLKESLRLTQKTEVKKIQKSIATITVENRKGTGFNIDEKGLIITNAHVVQNAKNVLVSFYKGKEYKGKIWELYPSIDLAVIKIEGNELPKLALAKEPDINHGDEVLIIGNPLAYTGIANRGVIYGISKVQELEEPILLIDGPVNKGNSGSPVLNSQGEVIGVIFAIINYGDINEKKLGGAIPIEYLLKQIEGSQSLLD